MEKEVMRQIINNLVLPNALEMNPDDLIVRYNNLLDFMDIRTSEDLMALREVIDEIYKKEVSEQEASDKAIFKSIMACNGSKEEAAFQRNVDHKHRLMQRLVPFAYFLRKKAIVREKWESNYGSVKVNNAIREIMEIVKRYEVRNACGCIVLPGQNRGGIVYGDTTSVVIAIAAVAKSILNENTAVSGIPTLDDILLNLASATMAETKPDTQCHIEVFPTSEGRKISSKLQKFIEKGLEADLPVIDKNTETLFAAGIPHIMCINTGMNVSCLTGPDKERTIPLLAKAVKAVIDSGDTRFDSFNKIASAIKNINEAFDKEEEIKGGKKENEYHY